MEPANRLEEEEEKEERKWNMIQWHRKGAGGPFSIIVWTDLIVMD
jgi:hypothetical protein